MLKILGANGAEDYWEVVDYQMVGGQLWEGIHSAYALGMTGGTASV